MSLCIVSREASVEDCVEAARCMWYQQEFPSKHMSRVVYERIAIRQIEGTPALIAMHTDGADTFAVGWLSYDTDWDLHFPGRGATVYNLVVDRYFPEALPALMRAFRKIIRADQCEWYQITKRIDECNLTSTFKRLPALSVQEAPCGQED